MMQATTVDAPPEVVRAFVQEDFDAWKGTNEDRILAYYTDDVVLQLPTGTLEGKNGRPGQLRASLYRRVPRQRARDPEVGPRDKSGRSGMEF